MSDEESTHEFLSIRAITEANKTELAVMQEVLRRLDRSLFGNGQPGVIEVMQKRIANHERWFWIASGAILTMQFLAGSGIISLKGLLGK